MARGIVRGRIVPAIARRGVDTLGQQIAHHGDLSFSGSQVQGCAPVVVRRVQRHAARREAAQTAEVPLATMFGYATDLRSKTQGRATYTMQFLNYQAVPNNIAEEIVAKVKGL